MRFRKLRIAWSVGCGIVCLLVIVLWVRSYWRADQPLIYMPHGYSLMGYSIAGRFSLSFVSYVEDTSDLGFAFHSDEVLESASDIPVFHFHKTVYSAGGWTEWTVYMPHWFCIMLSAAAATIPWIRWSNRFSLRTLLIATTLVAVVLGAVVWAATK
jgi:hypothetical protein